LEITECNRTPVALKARVELRLKSPAQESSPNLLYKEDVTLSSEKLLSAIAFV